MAPRVTAAVVTAVLVFLAGSLAIPDLRTFSIGDLLQVVAVSLALLGLIYELLWRPEIRTRDDGAVLVNPFRTVFVPWSLLQGTDLTWGLRLITTDGPYRGWAASGGPGAGQSWSTGLHIEGDYSSGLGFPTSMDSGSSPTLRNVLQGTPGGPLSGAAQAKVVVDDGWQAWQGRLPTRSSAQNPPTVARRWHWRIIIVIIGCAVAAFIASVL